jgi:hypothetical protein
MDALDSVKEDTSLLFLHKRLNRTIPITHINNKILDLKISLIEIKYYEG